jgi:hypothetical protein
MRTVHTKIGYWVFQMYTDRSFIHGVHKSAKLHQDVGHRDLFLYHFNYRGVYSFTPVFGNTTKNFGTFRQSSYTPLTERMNKSCVRQVRRLLPHSDYNAHLPNALPR